MAVQSMQHTENKVKYLIKDIRERQQQLLDNLRQWHATEADGGLAQLANAASAVSDKRALNAAITQFNVALERLQPEWLQQQLTELKQYTEQAAQAVQELALMANSRQPEVQQHFRQNVQAWINEIEAMQLPHDAATKVAQYEYQRDFVKLDDYYGIPDFERDVGALNQQFADIEQTLVTKKQAYGAKVASRSYAIAVAPEILAEAAMLLATVNKFSVASYSQQYALYRQLMKSAVTSGQTQQLIAELTSTTLNPMERVQVGEIIKTSADIKLVNPWQQGMADFIAATDRLAELQKRLPHDFADMPEAEYLGDLVKQVKTAIEMRQQNSVKQLIKQYQQCNRWLKAAQRYGSKFNIGKVVKTIAGGKRKFSRQMQQAELNDLAPTLIATHNNYYQVSRFNVNNGVQDLRQKARILLNEEKKLSLDAVAEKLTGALTVAEIRPLQQQLLAVQESLADLTEAKDSCMESVNQACKLSCLHAGVLAETQERLFSEAEKLSAEDAGDELALAIYEALDACGYELAKAKSPGRRCFNEIDAIVSKMKETKSAAIFERLGASVCRKINAEYLDDPSDKARAIMQLAGDLANRIDADPNYDKLEICKGFDDVLTLINAKNNQEIRSSLADVVTKFNRIHAMPGQANGQVSALAKSLSEFYNHVQSSRHQISGDLLENMNAMFVNGQCLPNEIELSHMAATLTKVEDLAAAVSAKEQVAHQLAEIKHFIQSVTDVDLQLSSVEEFTVTAARVAQNDSTADAKRLYQMVNDDLAKVKMSIEAIEHDIARVKNYREIVDTEHGIRDMDYKDVCDHYDELLQRKEYLLNDSLCHMQNMQATLERHQEMTQQVKTKICLEDMPWPKRIVKAWGFAFKHPKQFGQYIRTHKVKAIATLLGMAGIGILAVKAAPLVGVGALAIKIGTTAKVATALFGDAAVASAAMAKTAEQVEDTVTASDEPVNVETLLHEAAAENAPQPRVVEEAEVAQYDSTPVCSMGV